MARLSVALTTYNHGWALPRAIDAIVNQSRQPDEFIIQDDGSTDNSIDVIMPFVEKYRFIRFVQNEKNLGPIPAMQKVFRYTTGDYVYGAGADDWVLPGYFEKAMNMFEKYPQAGLSCGNPCIFIRENGQKVESELMWSDSPTYLSPEQLAEIIAGQAVYGHTVIVRRDAFNNAGGFIPELKWHSDWFYCLVIAFRHGLIYFPEAVAVDNAGSPTGYCATGSRDWNQQKEVVASVLRLLKSPEYRDVLPYFIRGAVLNLFPFDAVKVVMSNPEFWDPESLLLIQAPLHMWNNRLVQIRNERAKLSMERKVALVLKKCEELIDMKKYSESEPIVNDLLRQFPSMAEPFILKAKIEIGKENFNTALDASRRAHSLQPKNPKNNVLLGYIQYQLKDYQNARQSFLAALESDPENLDALLNLAELSMLLKQGDAAINLCKKAQIYHPENSEIPMILGDFYLEMNQVGEAMASYNHALKIDPSNEEIIHRLQNVQSA